MHVFINGTYLRLGKLNLSALELRRKVRSMLGFFALLSVSIFGLSACSQQESQLRIASNVWPGYELLYLAREHDYFENRAVRMVEMPSATVIIQALAAGNVEGACLTLDEVLTARAEGLELKVVAMLDFSMGADALLVKPEIENLSDLRGRRIGVEQSAVGAVMLSAVLEKAKLNLSDVQIAHMNVNAHRDAYLNDEVDALITFEPVISQLAKHGARRIFDSAMIPGRIIDVIAIRPDAIEQNPDAVRAVIAGHFKARHAYLNDPQAALPIIARRLNLTADEVPASFEGLELPDAQTNRDWMNDTNSKLEQSANELMDVLLKAELLPRRVDVTGLVDGRFLP